MFLTRWGQATDPTGWAAYYAVKLLYEAIETTGTLDGAAITAHLVNPKTVLDLGKGPGTSFRPWDRQLRQPLYTIAVDQDLEWVRTEVATWIGMAKLDAEIPGPGGGDPIARLDQLGDGPGGACRI
jgi:branched-chain amino acid transport system substrate-binding protein